MKKSDFYFDLPETLIAQDPLEKRSSSKLMVLDKENQTITHKHFSDIVNLLNKGDVLVLNNSKVIYARLFGIKEITNAKVEVLLLKEVIKDEWQALVGNAKVVKVDTIININSKLSLICTKVLENGLRQFKLIYSGNIYEILEEIGNIPLPPYIHHQLEDKNRYQTVYAKELGSVAAPTAGLHFDDKLLKQLEAKGVIIQHVTLHVGLGTFLPVKVDDIKDHKMHSEQYYIDQKTADTLNLAKANNQKIIAVGTTSLRTLESNFQKHQKFTSEMADTDIFIYPGFNILSIDGLITNFHLPESTLIMLVSAFSGYNLTQKAYKEAVLNKYRFFSFGDAMWIM